MTILLLLYEIPKGCIPLAGRALFLTYRKLLKIELAVLHYLNTNGTAIGEQHPAGVARFFIFWE